MLPKQAKPVHNKGFEWNYLENTVKRWVETFEALNLYPSDAV